VTKIEPNMNNNKTKINIPSKAEKSEALSAYRPSSGMATAALQQQAFKSH